jgi:hypothetical protein
MTVAYKEKRLDGTACHGYCCKGEFPLGPQHGRIPGRALDLAVLNVIVDDHVAATKIEAVRAAWRQAKQDVPRQRERTQARLREARRDADDVDARQGRALRSGRRFLAEKLDGELDQKLKYVKELERLIEREPPELGLFDEQKFEELLELVREMRQLFWSPTSSNLDRMTIFARLIVKVIYDGRTKEVVRLRVVWKDGRPDTSVEVKLFRAAYPRIAKGIREGRDYGTIADELNAAGYLNSSMTSWTRFAIGAAARAMGLGTGWPRHRPDDSAA